MTRFITLVGLLLFTLILCGCIPTQSVRTGDAFALEASASEAYARGDWEAAAAHYEALVVEVPRDANAWFRLGNTYARMGRTADAVRAYRETLIRDQRNVKAWHNMGVNQLREAMLTFIQLEGMTADGDALHQRASDLSADLARLLAGRAEDDAPAAQDSDIPDSTATDEHSLQPEPAVSELPESLAEPLEPPGDPLE
jgi:cytochrome c-type biogenesis protein CcmH/NrfG